MVWITQVLVLTACVIAAESSYVPILNEMGHLGMEGIDAITGGEGYGGVGYGGGYGQGGYGGGYGQGGYGGGYGQGYGQGYGGGYGEGYGGGYGGGYPGMYGMYKDKVKGGVPVKGGPPLVGAAERIKGTAAAVIEEFKKPIVVAANVVKAPIAAAAQKIAEVASH